MPHAWLNINRGRLALRRREPFCRTCVIRATLRAIFPRFVCADFGGSAVTRQTLRGAGTPGTRGEKFGAPRTGI